MKQNLQIKKQNQELKEENKITKEGFERMNCKQDEMIQKQDEMKQQISDLTGALLQLTKALNDSQNMGQNHSQVQAQSIQNDFSLVSARQNMTNNQVNQNAQPFNQEPYTPDVEQSDSSKHIDYQCK